MAQPLIAGVMLAAGASRRFGGPKLLHPLAGRPLICHAVEVALASRLARLYVVMRPGDAELRTVLAEHFPRRLRLVSNPRAAAGQVSSVKAGLAALGERYAGAMVLLGDMPYLTPGVIDTLCEAFARQGGLVIPRCEGDRWHPRLVPRRLFPAFLALADDGSGMAVLHRHATELVRVTVGPPEAFRDVDHAADLA